MDSAPFALSVYQPYLGNGSTFGYLDMFVAIHGLVCDWRRRHFSFTSRSISIGIILGDWNLIPGFFLLRVSHLPKKLERFCLNLQLNNFFVCL